MVGGRPTPMTAAPLLKPFASGRARLARYRINRHLFPSFPGSLESAFRQHYNTISSRIARIGLVVGTTLYLGFYFWDRIIDYPHSRQTLMIRILASAWFGTVILLPRAH